MKTAISLPDRLYVEAEKTATSMGIPRSQLFALALQEFIDRHKPERITEKLNQVYSSEEDRDSISSADVALESMRELTKNDAW